MQERSLSTPQFTQRLSPQGIAYLSWLQDRGMHGYYAQRPPVTLLFLCEGAALTEEQGQLIQRMGQAVGLPPSRFQSLCMGRQREDLLAAQVRQLRPTAILVLGLCPAFLSTPSPQANPPWQVSSSLQELLEFPLKKKETWAALLALKEHWSIANKEIL